MIEPHFESLANACRAERRDVFCLGDVDVDLRVLLHCADKRVDDEFFELVKQFARIVG